METIEMKTAVFPGSFDPVTKGHESLVKRAIPLFDRIVIAIGVNMEKKYMFTLEQRLQMLSILFKNENKVGVQSYEGLTVEYCKSINAAYLLRGLRNAADFEFERDIALMNSKLAPEIETFFLPAQAELTAIKSSIVRDIIHNGGDVTAFIPEGIELP